MITRRHALYGLGGAALAAGLPGLGFAKTAGARRFVLIQLRGAMDGLAAVPPYGEAAYARLRPTLAIARPGQAGGALDLDGFFGLHPALIHLHALFGRGEAAILHAVASPYRARSHFDAQDVMENGTARPHGAHDGWLNRALRAAPPAGDEAQAIAFGKTVPLVLRGQAPVTSWAPSNLPEPSGDLIDRLAGLYRNDPVLGPAFEQALAIDDMAGDAPRRQRGDRIGPLVEAAVKFLSDDEGPNIAVIDSNGWDTHANQGAADGTLAQRLGELDSALKILNEGLTDVWAQTAILIVTEFGRTVAENGTRGTDHGTAGAAFLAGGAVAGGRVIADWPGLSDSALFDGRDLAPTTDLRSVIKGVIRDHLRISAADLAQTVFPDSAGSPGIPGLLQA